jgi:hypothetical protein
MLTGWRPGGAEEREGKGVSAVKKPYRMLKI